MKLSQFIKDNRAELRDCINTFLNRVSRTASCNCHKSGTDHIHEDSRTLSDSELRQWILNDEGLYRWAKSEGVRL